MAFGQRSAGSAVPTVTGSGPEARAPWRPANESGDRQARPKRKPASPPPYGTAQRSSILRRSSTPPPPRLTALPEALGKLTQLQQLDVSNNQLTALPEALGQLTQLQQLDVALNQLTALPEALGKLTQLQQLEVSLNQLTALPVALGHSPSCNSSTSRTIGSRRSQSS